MCGPTTEEKSLQAQESSLSSVLQQNYNTQFKNQSDILSNLNSVLSPIVAAGPGQQGWTPGQAAAVNTNILNTTGANYANARRAAQNALAGQGGGAGNPSGIASGIEQQIQGSIASGAAGQTSTEENQALQANYAQGNANFNQAVAGSQALAQAYDPTAYADLATSANKSAFGEADTIQQQQNQLAKDIAGAAVGVGSSILTGGFGGSGGGGNAPAMGPGIGGDPFGALDPNVLSQL